MSRILSDDFKEVVTDRRKEVLGIKCDCCEKNILPKRYRRDDNKYFIVTTGHHDWGNDSIESIEYKDICPECIGKFVSDYCKEAEGTEYIDIKTEHIYEGGLVSVERWHW